MRGLTHYISGLAAATFFPALVADLRMGVLIPTVAGVAAYFPDFVDFKFGKFLSRVDYDVEPAPWDRKLKYAPKLFKISELSERNRYQFVAVEGKVEEVLVKGSGKVTYTTFDGKGQEKLITENCRSITFVLNDGTGKITVEAVGEDYEFFEEEFGRIESGREMLVFGYVDFDENGLRLVVADAPHPQLVADMVARAIGEAYEKGEVRMKIRNIRLPGDVFRRFFIYLDPPKREVRVEMGPIVTPGGVEITGPVPEYRRYGIAKVNVPFIKTYPKPTRVDAFNGADIAFRVDYRGGKKVVKDRFLPWHHGFSHSLTAGLVFAAVVWLLFKAIGYAHTNELAAASVIGYWLHVFEDQLGFMGTNLLPPVTKDVVPGFKLGESGSGLTNFSTTWLMISFMIWNFNRFTTPRPIPIGDAKLLLLLVWPSILGFGIAIAKSIKMRKELKELMDYYTNLEAFEELEEVGGI